MRAQGWLTLTIGVCCAAQGRVLRAQPQCFRTVAEAAAQTGATEAGAEGFRVETVRQDALRGGSWATVVVCGHPERPRVVIRVASQAIARMQAQASLPVLNDTRALPPQAPAVLAGAVVRVVRQEALVRFETGGTATASAAAGQHVRVRVGEQGEIEGIVQNDGSVALE